MCSELRISWWKNIPPPAITTLGKCQNRIATKSWRPSELHLGPRHTYNTAVCHNRSQTILRGYYVLKPIIGLHTYSRGSDRSKWTNEREGFQNTIFCELTNIHWCILIQSRISYLWKSCCFLRRILIYLLPESPIPAKNSAVFPSLRSFSVQLQYETHGN